jgi:hypothetical protein
MGALEDIARLMSAPGPSPYAASNAPPLTQLSPLDELAFRGWVKQNGVPFDPNAAQSDYDMRGFYQGLQQQNPRAVSAVNANDGRLHFPDYWKTPLHQTFSGESKFAGPVAPKWNDQDQLISPGGRILFDEKAQ